MKTITLKLNNIEYGEVIATGLIVLLLSMVFMYFYFINASVLSVVERENIEKTISTMSSNISNVETEYFTKVNNINIDMAVSMGFKEIKSPLFAVRKTMAKQLVALNNY